MAAVLEDAAKMLMAERGGAVPRGRRVEGPAEARSFARELARPVVLKALAPAGRRGRAGAVRFANSPEEAEEHARALLGTTVHRHPVRALLVEERLSICQELYLAFTLTSRGCPAALASRRGGVEVEELTARDPGALRVREVDVLVGFRTHHAMALWEEAGLGGSALREVSRLSAALYEFFRRYDALLAEVNPLALTEEGGAVAAAAVVNADDEALFRQPRLQSLGVEYGSDRSLGPRTERERMVIEADLAEPHLGPVRYTELPGGEIGLALMGGGAGLMQFDLVERCGGRPANHSDMSPGQMRKKLTVLIKAILSKPGVRGLLCGTNIMSLAKVSDYALAVRDALEELGVDCRTFPVVARVAGLDEE
ncbi:MAG: ATP-grasp domain-containing protein, partial [Nitrospinota bacterium]